MEARWSLLLKLLLGGGPRWASEGLIVPRKPGNAGGGKGPWFWVASDGAEERRLAFGPNNSAVIRTLQRELYFKAKS
jgi:hypothetical protein